MAHLYKRGCKFWISYYLSGKLVQKSLKTKNERVALAKKKRIEYELALGDLHVASKTPLSAMLESFCKELMATRTFKSYNGGCTLTFATESIVRWDVEAVYCLREPNHEQ